MSGKITLPSPGLTEADTPPEQLWSIIEKQRFIIQDLQKALARMTAERDALLKAKDAKKQNTIPETGLSSQDQNYQIRRREYPPQDALVLDQEEIISPTGPVPPPRSPYRQNSSKDSGTQDPRIKSSKTPITRSSTLPSRAGADADPSIYDVPSTPTTPSTATYRSEIQSPVYPPQNIHTPYNTSPNNTLQVINQAHIHEKLRRSSSVPDLIKQAHHQQLHTSTNHPEPVKQAPPFGHPLQALAANPMAGVIIRVIGSNLSTNKKGKNVASFTISIGRHVNDAFEELWRVEKSYSDILDFDAQLRRHGRLVTDHLEKLPDKALFTSYAPSKVDQRKIGVEQYLQSTIKLQLPDMAEVCEFLSTNVIDAKQHRNTVPGHKEGYITKRGKNFGGWKVRYFILDGPVLRYYENKDGPFLGIIRLSGAQIGRQTAPTQGSDITSSFRHALIILEPKKTAPNGIHRHVLCADSDADRDEWIDALSQYINYPMTDHDDESFDKSSERSKKKSATKADNAQKTHTARYHHPHLSASDPTLNPASSSYMSSDASISSSTTSTSDGRQPPYHQATTETSYGYPQQQRPYADPTDYLFPYADADEDLESEAKNSKKQNRRTIWGRKLFATAPSDAPSNGHAINFSDSGFADANDHLRYHTVADRDHPANGSAGSQASREVFGVSLEQAVNVSRISNHSELPAIVYRCIEYLETRNAKDEEGIYRLSGSAAKIKGLKDRFNKEGDICLLDSDEYHDVHTITGLLKLWLRELPSNILTNDLMSSFVDYVDRLQRTRELGRLVSMLPPANYHILRTLSAHLVRIVQNSVVNKMTIRNIGIVFSATLGMPSGVFSLFLTEFRYIFWHTNDILRDTILPGKGHYTKDDFSLEEPEQHNYYTLENHG
ncbi:uncharacterized protein BYT42DRAFT_490709 [Radiomyces spectabilis]|uniref:uncharacterized protein n=1 Tax=Radiomyces spectabilis TaxID=64574 RepID=UPI00221FE301|nr:uncharacterized protein BYT42DRAFT_490709 [Radiomyces spectabilis]KAI8390997.1 hypothetical protein BYT42DRAFT_490709 [Radiomyces spectabilis]